MNITKENVNDLNAVISLKIVAEDYTQKVEDVLKDYRKKAKVDGFRPGMVPMGMIKRMYYKPVLAEEINKLVSESLMNFIQEEKLKILGEPLAHDGQKPIDFDTDTEFEFSFDVGLVPDFAINAGKDDQLPFYNITVGDNTVNDYVDNVAKRFGDFIPVEVSTGSELVKGSIMQVDEQQKPVEGGFTNEEASYSLDMIKDEEVRKQFTGIKSGDKVVFDIRKAYPNDTDLIALFKTDKEKAPEITGLFEASVKEIKKFEKHPVNQELFDKAYGEGIVKTEDEFKDKIREEIKANYERESNYRFALDTKDYLIKKANLSLPVEFLKRWLLDANEKMTREQVDKDFAGFETEFQWQLIKDQLVRENSISVSDEELFEFSMMMARNQFYQYGLYNVADEHIERYVNEQLSRKEDVRRLREQKFEEKVILFMKENATLGNKEITLEDFQKLFEK